MNRERLKHLLVRQQEKLKITELTVDDADTYCRYIGAAINEMQTLTHAFSEYREEIAFSISHLRVVQEELADLINETCRQHILNDKPIELYGPSNKVNELRKNRKIKRRLELSKEEQIK